MCSPRSPPQAVGAGDRPREGEQLAPGPQSQAPSVTKDPVSPVLGQLSDLAAIQPMEAGLSSPRPHLPELCPGTGTLSVPGHSPCSLPLTPAAHKRLPPPQTPTMAPHCLPSTSSPSPLLPHTESIWLRAWQILIST